MGWSETYKPKGMSMQEFMQEHVFGQNHRILKSCTVGGVFYAATERVFEKRVYAAVVLVKYVRPSRQERHAYSGQSLNLMYKDMDESMGPCYYECPPAILNLLSEPRNEHAKQWREKCLQNWQAKASRTKLKDGDIIKIDGEPISFVGGYEFSFFRVEKGLGKGLGQRVRYRGMLSDGAGHYTPSILVRLPLKNYQYVVVQP